MGTLVTGPVTGEGSWVTTGLGAWPEVTGEVTGATVEVAGGVVVGILPGGVFVGVGPSLGLGT